MTPSNAKKSPPHPARRKAAWKAAAKGKPAPAAVLVSGTEDVRYLTGFTGDDSWLLMGARWAVLVTDGRYDEQARAECPDLEIHVRTGKAEAVFADYLRKHKARSLGIQAEHVTVLERDRLAEALGPSRRVVPLRALTANLRERKDDGEVQVIGRAVRIAQAALRGLLAGGAAGLIGRSERDVAADLDHRMRSLGAQGPSFETIVAAGAHASRPHYRPGGAKVREGACLLIDWGARVDGYCSDLTRTFFVRTIPPEMAKVYDTVRRAQEAGVSAVRAGRSAASVDLAARAVIEAAGYGDRFVHGLGHGIGLEVHEGPGVSRSSPLRLRAGQVVTIEPGIYLPGVGGVRIEDDVLVTPEGGRRLSSLPRSLASAVLP